MQLGSATTTAHVAVVQALVAQVSATQSTADDHGTFASQFTLVDHGTSALVEVLSVDGVVCRAPIAASVVQVSVAAQAVAAQADASQAAVATDADGVALWAPIASLIGQVAAVADEVFPADLPPASA